MNRISCLLALTLAAACGGSNNASVALSARTGTAASTAASAVNQQAQALQACGTIVITRLRMVVSEVKLEGPASADAGTADEVEFKSAPMLLESGCRWVIVGHSERRQLFGETDAGVREKTTANYEE